MTDTTTRDLLNHVIEDVFRRKENHQRLYKHFRRLYMIIRTIVHLLNAITMTSIIITFYGHTLVLIVCATTSTVSTLLTTALTTLRFNDRFHSHQNSYVRYKALHDRFQLLSLRTGLTEQQLQDFVTELNECIGLILDRSEPISTSSHRFVVAPTPVTYHRMSLATIRDINEETVNVSVPTIGIS
jgi:hypothetical protein